MSLIYDKEQVIRDNEPIYVYFLQYSKILFYFQVVHINRHKDTRLFARVIYDFMVSTPDMVILPYFWHKK